jgi:hypothetical protein
MDKALIVESFVRLYGSRISSFFALNTPPVEVNSKSNLKDFADAVRAIANDPNGSAEIAAAEFEDGKSKVKASFAFNTAQARVAMDNIEARKRVLDASTDADHERVLMVFVQSNTKNPTPGRRTGELVSIEEVDKRPLPLIYASDLAEERIKHEIREVDDNVYKKGFIVDVNVEIRSGRQVGFRVTHVHQVIDLPE